MPSIGILLDVDRGARRVDQPDPGVAVQGSRSRRRGAVLIVVPRGVAPRRHVERDVVARVIEADTRERDR
ncbi:MAG: hypothetical protein E6J91_05980 [Deltaproteobacteria bacterium]|nr:MAG: hypothetical protein E6J91_05980 [Deltaproteobacteria bacterium]